VALVVVLLTVALSAVSAWATHFRYGHYLWIPVGGNTIDVTVQNAFRRNGYVCRDPATGGVIPCRPGDGLPQVNDVILETIGATTFNWGDGSAPVGSPFGPLLYIVTSVDFVNNWWFGLALDPASLPAINTTLSHTYAAPGTYTAFTQSCCRISRFSGVNEHINNPDGFYRVETKVKVGAGQGNSSPVSALPAVVPCPRDALCTFTVPAADPNGTPLQFRLSTALEASGVAGGFTQPPGASIDPVTGVYTWDTTGRTVSTDPTHNTLYSTQVTIENSSGAAVALDFLIRICKPGEDCTPPFIDSPRCEATEVTIVGDLRTFDVTAEHGTTPQPVILNVAGLPVGATMTPELPETGDPVKSTFSWTPGPAQVGTVVVNFFATNAGGGGYASCPVKLQVIAQPDHFLSYRTNRSRGSSAFQLITRRLKDQFEDKLFDVVRPLYLYTPADKEGEGITDLTTHLEGYQIRLARTTPRQALAAVHKVAVTNQFHVDAQPLLLDTLQPDRLLVPTAKCIDGPGDPCPDPVAPPDPATHAVDHFKCYRVRPSRGAPRFKPILGVSVDDQFTPAPRLFDLRAPSRLCNPVDKEGEGIKIADNHLLCYQAIAARGQLRDPAVRGIHLSNQFGQERVDKTIAVELCVPSRKAALSTTVAGDAAMADTADLEEDE
jgi:hypothetical protein